MRDRNRDQFFRHENHSYPPSLSDDGVLHLGAKSDLLACLEDVFEAQQDAPAATCVVLDGTAIIQMLKPTAAKTLMIMPVRYSFHSWQLSYTMQHDLI